MRVHLRAIRASMWPYADAHTDSWAVGRLRIAWRDNVHLGDALQYDTVARECALTCALRNVSRDAVDDAL